MLGLFKKIQAVQDVAGDLYKAIEQEYQHELAGRSVPDPMKVPSNKGKSNKLWHDNAFTLACSAYNLTGEPSKGYQNIVLSSFAVIKTFQSAQVPGSQDPRHPKVPVHLNAVRIELVDRCQELVSDMTQFTKDPKSFITPVSMESLLAFFAETLVDTNIFGCTPEIFELALKKVNQHNGRDLQKERNSLQYWFELNDKFNELVRPKSFILFDRAKELYITNLGSADERACSLARELLSELPGDNIVTLRREIRKKHQALLASAVVVGTAAPRAPLTFGYNNTITTPVSLPSCGLQDVDNDFNANQESKQRKRRVTRGQA